MFVLLRPFLVILLAIIIVAQVPEMRPDLALNQMRLSRLNQAVCRSKPDFGNCKGHRRLWYFNVHRYKCEKFTYSNCGGNRNRFFSKSECDEFCTQQVKHWKAAESKQNVVVVKPT